MEKLTRLVVESPWCLQRGTKSKKYPLNLNTFLGLDYTMGNMLKKFYVKLISPQLLNCVLKTPVEVSIQVYNPSRRKSDKGNIVAMSSKFLYDAMTYFKVWEDDNDTYLKTETILPSKYDKNNGRVVFTFTSVEEDQTDLIGDQ